MCVKRKWQSLCLDQKNESEFIQEEEITPRFQLSPVKRVQPAPVRHGGAFPVVLPKKSDSFGVLFSAGQGAWNRALYQMKCLDPVNCSLAFSSCRSSWFYKCHRVRPCFGVEEFYVPWELLNLSLYTTTIMSYHTRCGMCAHYACFLQIIKWHKWFYPRKSLPATIKLNCTQFFA